MGSRLTVAGETYLDIRSTFPLRGGNQSARSAHNFKQVETSQGRQSVHRLPGFNPRFDHHAEADGWKQQGCDGRSPLVCAWNGRTLAGTTCT